MYKLTKDYLGNSINIVIRLSDGLNIPFNLNNIEYEEYLKWVAEGNTPEAAE
jgi:hypothetical protein